MTHCTPSEPAADLLLEIARCPNVRQVLAEGDRDHPCSEIVLSQGADSLAALHVPEPWNGDLEHAPILFLSSNPSFAPDEAYPNGAWPDDEVKAYFTCRFGGDRKTWVDAGMHALKADGIRFPKSVYFWSSIRNRAAELLDVNRDEVRPGVDYAISEVVHCKSRSEIGVQRAAAVCSSRYLERILAVSGAKVIVCLGKHAAGTIRTLYTLPAETNVAGPVAVGGTPRHITFLPHPSSFGPGTFATCFTSDALLGLQRVLRG